MSGQPLFIFMYIIYFISLFLIFQFLSFSQDLLYKDIHYRSFLIDGHNDAIQRIVSGEDLGRLTEKGHIDIPRLREGGVDLAFFAIWVPPFNKKKSYYNQAIEQINSFQKFVEKNQKDIITLKKFSDIEYYKSQGKIISILSMEGAHPLEDKLENLDYFYELGIRSVMPTWNNSTSWATSAADENQKKIKRKGLTKLGKKFIKRMNELGILIDVSHVGEQTFWDIIKITSKPIIASHSSVWKICPNKRNLNDKQIIAIAKSGGLVAINFAPAFLVSTFEKKEKELRLKHSKVIDSIKNNWKGNVLSRELYIGQLLKKEYDKILPSVETVVDHIDYIVKLVGVDYVGLGSDFDGIGRAPKGLEDISCYPNITKELLRRGYSEDDIRKILGGNFLRVLKQVLK